MKLCIKCLVHVNIPVIWPYLHCLHLQNGWLFNSVEGINWTIPFQNSREVHRVCMAKKLNLLEAENAITNFTNQFYNLFMDYNLSMTLKTHIVIHHYMYYFKETGKTMRLTSGEHTESCHSTLRKSEEQHNFNCKRKLGSPMHQQKSWQSLTLFNSKRAGQVTPLRLKKKSSSPSPHSSHQTPFSKHFLKKYPHVMEEHNIIHKKIVK